MRKGWLSCRCIFFLSKADNQREYYSSIRNQHHCYLPLQITGVVVTLEELQIVAEKYDQLGVPSRAGRWWLMKVSV